MSSAGSVYCEAITMSAVYPTAQSLFMKRREVSPFLRKNCASPRVTWNLSYESVHLLIQLCFPFSIDC